MGRGETDGRARQLGRYAVFDEIAAGGMASVHIGRLAGPGGFARTVAVKRLHSHLARDPHFSSRFLEEARLAARVCHPNVVSIVDVVEHDGEVALIMDFVLGESLSKLLGKLSATGRAVPTPLASGILVPVLHGLHAAHETRAEDGSLLGLVHRDVSPQNILVGADGVCRVLDFGIAKAASLAADRTQEGILKGKIGYLAPEQLRGQTVDRRVDIFAAGVVLWEMLTGGRLYKSETPEEAVHKILDQPVVPPSRMEPTIPQTLDAVVLQALARDPDVRFETAADMAVELERCARPASAAQIAQWVESVAAERMNVLRDRVSVAESSPGAPSPTEAAEAETAVDLPTPAGPPSGRPPEPGSPPPGRPRGPLPVIVAFSVLVALLGGIGYYRSLAKEVGAPTRGQASASASSAGSAAPPAVASAVAASLASACPPEDLGEVTALASGPASRFTCALRQDHSVWCWGDNEAGQMADGTREPALVATKIGRLEPAVEVAAGNRHACAVLGDTRVACWGKDLLSKPTRVVGLEDVLHVRCGGRHGCVSRNEGGILCWGENDRGQLGTTEEAALTSPVQGFGAAKQISTGTDHSCAVLDADGTVWCWGDNTYGQLGQGRTDRDPHPRPVPVPGLPASSQVAAGDKTTFVRTQDGHVHGWGFGIKRPVQLPIEAVATIAAGGKQNCALDDEAGVWCWGFNDFGQLGAATPDDSATPVRQKALSGVKALAVGDVHVCALLDDGHVACWGSNEQGQLGTGTKDRDRHPEAVRVRLACPASP